MNTLPPTTGNSSVPVNLDAYCRAVEQHAIISITDVAGNIVYANHLFCEISGYGLDELIGANHRIIKSGLHQPEVFRVMWETISAGQSWHGEVCNLKKNGDTYWVKATIVPVLDENGLPTHYISTRTDITEQKLQNELSAAVAREQDELLRLAPFGIARLTNRTFARLNDAFAVILGYEKEELLGCSTRKIYFSGAQFEEMGTLAYEPLARGEVFKLETRLQHKDGSTVWVIAGGSSLDISDPTRDMLFMIQDITEHRRLEENLATALEHTRTAEKAKAEFLRAMTHELRTPLNGILGTGQLIESMLDDAELKSLITISNQSARAVIQMIDTALQYSALEPGKTIAEIRRCGLGECVSAVLWQSRELARKFDVTLINGLLPENVSCEIDTDQKMFTDLIELVVDNAIRFNRPGGSVTITANCEMLCITDTGVGMSPDQVAHVKDPFVRFCMDGDRAGSGLGMALVARIATVLGIWVDVRSEVDVGTTVRIHLPPSR